MRTVEIKVNQEVVNYIERLQFEVTSEKDIIVTLLDAHKSDKDASFLESEVFKTYQEKHAQKVAEYELIKENMSEEYIPTCLKGHEIDWNLDFSTNVLTITIKCECGEKAFEEYLNSKKED